MARRSKDAEAAETVEVGEPAQPQSISDVVAEARRREEAAKIRVAPEPIRVKKTPPPQDIIPPVITGADIIAGLPNQMKALREMRLKALARSNSDVAQLLAERKKP